MSATATTSGPWPRPVALFNARTLADAQAWAHWIARPCATCSHAFIDHDNNPFEGTEACRHCGCRSFAEPAVLTPHAAR